MEKRGESGLPLLIRGPQPPSHLFQLTVSVMSGLLTLPW